MADDSTTVVDTTSLQQASADATKYQAILGTIQVGLKTVLDTITTFGKTASQSAKDATVATAAYADVLSSMRDILKNGEDRTFSSLIEGAQAATGEADKLTKVLATVGAFTMKGDVFDKFSVNGSSAINTVNTHIAELTSAMSKMGVPASVTDKLTNFAENASAAQKLEGAYTSLAAATGNLNDLFQDNKLKDLSSLTAQYTDFVMNAADATSQDGQAVFGYASQLGTIPGFMKSIISSSSDAAGQTDGLTTAMKLMMGSGKDMGTVTGELTKAYEDLSNAQGALTDEQSAQKGAQFFSTIAEASSTLKLRFSDVENAMNSLADSFKFIGDNTEAGANIFARYTDALRQTGLTSKAAVDTIGTMISGIEGLTVAQKAYISLQNGGPGGLQGAFKIEQMMREGKTDDVMKMAENTMRQKFGGRIVGLNEAASNSTDAAQFMKERTMLQSGMFGIGKNTSDEQATHILEALRNNDSGAMKEIMTGQKAVDNVISKGNEIQKNNQDITMRMANAMERVQIATELMAGLDRKSAVGNMSGFAQQNNQAVDYYGMASRDSARNMGNFQAHDASADLARQRNGAATGLVVNGSLVANGIGNMMKGAVSGASQVMNNSHLNNTHQGAHSMVHLPNGNQRNTTAETTTMTKNHSTEAVVHLNITAPEGFDVVAKSGSSKVKTSVSHHNQLAQTGAWVPR